jgi:hypothetical protein
VFIFLIGAGVVNISDLSHSKCSAIPTLLVKNNMAKFYRKMYIFYQHEKAFAFKNSNVNSLPLSDQSIKILLIVLSEKT